MDGPRRLCRDSFATESRSERVLGDIGRAPYLGEPEPREVLDSRTGALDLYLRLGMKVHLTYSHYSKLLRRAEAAAAE